MKKLLGFQIADLSGKNIQGDDSDPTNLASFDIMSPERATAVLQGIGSNADGSPKFLLMPIYEGCIDGATIDGQPLKFEREPDEEGDDLIAVAPTGSPIVGTADMIPGNALIESNSFKRKTDGSLEYEYAGDTDVCWNGQYTKELRGKELFVDEEGEEWTEDQIRLIRNPEAK